MSRNRITDQKGLNFLTCTVVGWIDVFSRKAYRDILLESISYCRKEKHLRVFAYVIMSNHIHLIAQAEPDDGPPLSNIMRDFKKYTANKLLEAIQQQEESRRDWMLHLFGYYARTNANNRYFQVWQQDNHPIALFSPAVTWQKLTYIHFNPVRAGIVEHPEDYLYSSAKNYASENCEGLIEVDLLEPYLPWSGFGYAVKW